MDKLALIEALKELGRVVLIAIVPVLIEQLTNGSVDVKTIGIIATLAVLRAIDKFLHETGKNAGDPNLMKGLTQF